MSDNPNEGKVLYSENKPLNTPEVANPEGTTSQEPSTEESLESPITRKEAKELESRLYRQFQSLTDRMASNFDTRLSEKLSAFNKNLDLMKSTGQDIDESKVAAARQKIMDDTLAESGQSVPNLQNTGELVQQGKKSETPTDGMESLLSIIDTKFGGPVMQDDPEAAMIKMEDPLTFLKTYEEAAAKKAERLATPAEARLTSMATGSNQSQDAEALAARLLELQANPSANKEERAKLKIKLRELQGKN